MPPILPPTSVVETDFPSEVFDQKGEQNHEEIYDPPRGALLRRLHARVLGMTRNGLPDESPERPTLGAFFSHVRLPECPHVDDRPRTRSALITSLWL